MDTIEYSSRKSTQHTGAIVIDRPHTVDYFHGLVVDKSVFLYSGKQKIVDIEATIFTQQKLIKTAGCDVGVFLLNSIQPIEELIELTKESYLHKQKASSFYHPMEVMISLRYLSNNKSFLLVSGATPNPQGKLLTQPPYTIISLLLKRNISVATHSEFYHSSGASFLKELKEYTDFEETSLYNTLRQDEQRRLIQAEKDTLQSAVSANTTLSPTISVRKI